MEDCNFFLSFFFFCFCLVVSLVVLLCAASSRVNGKIGFHVVVVPCRPKSCKLQSKKVLCCFFSATHSAKHFVGLFYSDLTILSRIFSPTFDPSVTYKIKESLIPSCKEGQIRRAVEYLTYIPAFNWREPISKGTFILIKPRLLKTE